MKCPSQEGIQHWLGGLMLNAYIAGAIATLHVKGYAETREWSQPLPTQTPGEYLSILRRLLWLEDK